MESATLMVQGTASSVGKSWLVTALCRLFRQEGLRVAPFKAQNMALNAFVTPEGGEIGRAQAVQAEAAGVAPHVDMNPILLKPEAEARAQVVVLGKSAGSLSAADYHARKPELRATIAACLRRLRARHDLVIIEGAGSPVEVNLKAHEIVNMHVARAAGARVLLVGDIDRGGVFAAFVGTMELLDPEERALVGATVINKFRGDLGLLAPGLDFLARRTGVPVAGVLPYLRGLRLADEDSLSLDERPAARRASAGDIDVAVVRLPRLSNHDDLLPLEREDDVTVRFVDDPAALAGADLVVLPGSKSTIADLGWLRATGLAEAIEARARAGRAVLGLCGGCQMLGRAIADPDHVESDAGAATGLGLLPVDTVFDAAKVTAQVRAWARAPSFLTAGIAPDAELAGYEIHHGRLLALDGAVRSPFEIERRSEPGRRLADGAVSADGAVVGTMIHGVFENQAVREAFLRLARARRGMPERALRPLPDRDADYDRLADTVRASLDIPLLRRLAALPAG